MKEKLKSIFLILLLLLLAACAAGAGYYILKIKPFREAEDTYLEAAETYENAYAEYTKALTDYNGKADKCERAAENLRKEIEAAKELIQSDEPYSDSLLEDLEHEVRSSEKKLSSLPDRETAIPKEELPEPGTTVEDLTVSIQLIAEETDRIRAETEDIREMAGKIEIPDFSKEAAKLTALAASVKDSIYDPFENLVLSFSGTEPNGIVTIDRKSDTGINGLYTFVTDTSTKLCNGDEIIVTVKPEQNLTNEDLNDKCLAEYGKVISVFKKRYKVEGLSYYISSATEISEETFSKMQLKAEESLQAYADANWKDVVGIQEMTYLGNYFLKKKATTQGYFQDGAENQLVLLYRVKCKIDLTPKNKEYKKDVEYIYTITYKNLINLYDGTCKLDLNSFTEPEESFRIDTGVWSGFLTKYKFTFKGYEDLDAAFNKICAEQNDHYEYTIDLAE